MGALKVVFALFAVITGLTGVLFYRIITPKPIPKFDESQYWGPGKQPDKLDDSIREFTVQVPKEVLLDLKWRLDHLRPLVPPLEGIHHQYGFSTNLLKKVVDYWRTDYNWTERQVYFNQFPQYKTNIQGLDIHYLHVKPKNPGNKKVLPLLIIHGWPGSVREFYEIIPILTTAAKDRDFVFELIAPHIPGYGFSQAASKPGLGANQIAVIMRNLMFRLGFKQFYCQGGDFGAIILQSLTVLYPENVLGYHTNMASIMTPLSYIKYILGSFCPSWLVKPEHQDRVFPLWDKFVYRIRETGYLHLQATKPDTIGVGATDSPAGLAAYILEKFVLGTNRNYLEKDAADLLQEKYSYASLIDNLMVYWITGSATTSFRLYAESFNRNQLAHGVLRNPLKVPTAIARFEYDFYVADGIISELFPNNLQLSDLEGGHFAAFERPETFAKDLISAVQKFEEYNAKNPKK
uniref:Epoxide hydrolase n=1 Tax=Dendroctonus ponderosae TaxID=77166 RepID=J3JVZ7_DENPD|nr:unknown [Dendroctonus ponderosae]